MFLYWPAHSPPPWAAVWPTMCGFTDDNDKRFHARIVRPFFCVHLVERGEVEFASDARTTQTLHAGAMFAIWPGQPFAYFWKTRARQRDCRIRWVRLTGPLARPFMEALGFTPDRLCVDPVDPARVAHILEEIVALATQADPMSGARAVTWLHELIPACGHLPAPIPPPAALSSRAAKLVEEELDLGLNVEQLARIFQVSRATLYLHFMRDLGVSPAEYLIDARIREARRRLEQTGDPLTEIAQRVGYRSLQYFSRQFAARTGMPPGAYRERAQKGETTSKTRAGS